MGEMTNGSDEMVLRKETVTGFIDRGGNFRPGEHDTLVAERWVSDWINVRPNPNRGSGGDGGADSGD